jgi:MFS family permease
MAFASRPVTRARVAVTVVFAVNGAVFSSLFSRLPAIKADLALSDGQLGLILLLAAIGLLAAQLIAGGTIGRAGARAVMAVAAPVYCAAIALAALAPSGPWLAAVLLVLGAANGMLDVAMNVAAAAVERRLGRPAMSSFHAAFSFGALGGAGLGALAAAAELRPLPHLALAAALTTCVAGAAILTLPAAVDRELPATGDAAGGEGSPTGRGGLLALPPRALAALGALAFCVLLAEGSVADWSAIYLREGLGASQALAAAGLAAFSLTMGLGRLAGDRLVARAGPRAIATSGLAIAAAGLGAVAAVDAPTLAIAGFALVGVGLSTVFPLVVSAAARRAELPPGPAIAAVASAGYAGFLVGPPAIGLLAELLGLRTALLLPALLCAAALALVAGLAGREGREPGRLAS